jgi:hypothetical protein
MSKDLTLGSIFQAMSKIASNLYWPRILGGVPRSYIQKTVAVDSSSLEKLRELSETGHLKVIQDSTFQMDDAMKVSSLYPERKQDDSYIHRPTKRYSPTKLGERLLLPLVGHDIYMADSPASGSSLSY